MYSSACLLFLANSLPRFKDGTDAEVRRLRFIRFDHRPERPDPQLKILVEADAPGVFVELARRAKELLCGRPLAKQGTWGQITSERFAVSNDPVEEFVKQYCRLDPGAQCEKGVLYEEFDAFRKQHGLSDKLDESVFFRRLYDRFPGVKQSKIRIAGERTRVVTGIEPKEDDDE